MTVHIRIRTRDEEAARRDLAASLAEAAYVVAPDGPSSTYRAGVVELALDDDRAEAVDLDRLVDDLRRRGYTVDLVVTQP
jgi:hypothetical protein